MIEKYGNKFRYTFRLFWDGTLIFHKRYVYADTVDQAEKTLRAWYKVNTWQLLTITK